MSGQLHPPPDTTAALLAVPPWLTHPIFNPEPDFYAEVSMSMIHCRGCGQAIHESASSCPKCGAVQFGPAPTSARHWMALVSLVLSIFLLLGSLEAETVDTDVLVGTYVLGLVSAGLGAVSLHLKRPGQSMAVIGITLTVLSLLIVHGNTL
jgi:hypothetical protein